jgi:O-antigen ligase
MIILLKKERHILFYLLLGIIACYLLLPAHLRSWPNGSIFKALEGRIMMWKIAYKIILYHPFVGSGLHTFCLNYKRLCLPGYPFYQEGAPYAHNMYVQMVAEIGIFGLLAFLAFVASIFKALWITYAQVEDKFIKILSLGLLGSMSAYLVHGILESSFYTAQGAILFWIITGMSMALSFLKTKKTSNFCNPI